MRLNFRCKYLKLVLELESVLFSDKLSHYIEQNIWNLVTSLLKKPARFPKAPGTRSPETASETASVGTDDTWEGVFTLI